MKRFWMLLILLMFACSPSPPINPLDSTGEALQTEETLALPERGYAWYLSQEGSGPYETENCGPAVTAMSLKWYDQRLDVSIAQARSEYRPEGGWWYTNDIEAMLKAYEVPFSYHDYVSSGDITKVIDQGQIAILCLDTRFILEGDEKDSRIGRHYEGDFGHFVIAKGYEKIEGKLYIEVYDPWNAGTYYEDGTPKGKDRLYPAAEVDLAIRNWWNQIIVIGQENHKK